jgi:alpha-galactosidase
MSKNRMIYAAAALFLLAATAVGQEASLIKLNQGWKFLPGDNLDYAKPGFDDSGWKAIGVDKIWEEQGYDPLDGFAWYRLRVTIPSALKKAARIQDGLRIFLGKINNFDQAFLNGRLFGSNGRVVAPGTAVDDSYTKAETELWNRERCYVLPPDDPRIRWDRENVIAVRVFDEGGQGGMYTGDQSLRMVLLSDYLALDCGAQPFVLRQGRFNKSFSASNGSSVHTLRGTLDVTGLSKLDGREIVKEAYPLELPPQARQAISLTLPQVESSIRLTYAFRFADSDEAVSFVEEAPYILTPPPPSRPRINGASVVGGRPGRPFLHLVAATGRRPLVFGAAGLPQGLAIDSATGIISGRVDRAGEYRTTIVAKNGLGQDARELKIVIGDRIALTPPLGWNSWNCWGLAVDEGKVVASAKTFIAKGLADHGWTYINIDDGWEIKGDSAAPKRDGDGNILTNEKFPDMKRLGDAIHGLGLKFGIYSSPGPLTCGGYTASYQHELQDARAFAAWGVDYLKYDWCSYDKIAKDTSLEELKKPYRLMRGCLDQVDRDIVFSLCQYGMGKVWEWGADVGGNLWRTTDDITDTWKSLSEIGFGQVENAPYAGPGHWNDPDMLVVGWVGWGPSLHPTRLTPDEQYTHISLWCLLSAPLLIGCDLERLDDFTLSLLTNDEVLALDQDPLGRQATLIKKDGAVQVWVKELADGRRAVGLFNLGEESVDYVLDLAALGWPSAPGREGKVAVRDLWRQEELGTFSGRFQSRLSAHGVRLLALRRS